MSLRLLTIAAAIGAAMTVAPSAEAAYTTSGINIRAQPYVANNVIGYAPGGAWVDIYECVPSWCRGRYGSTVGWMSRSYLSGVGYTPPPPGPAYPAPPPPPPPGIGYPPSPPGGLPPPPVYSDVRVKHDIAAVGRLDNGIGLYSYRYLWSDQVYVGVMAQEVAAVVPAAVIEGADGYLLVDYARLGLRLMTWDEWSAAARERSH